MNTIYIGEGIPYQYLCMYNLHCTLTHVHNTHTHIYIYDSIDHMISRMLGDFEHLLLIGQIHNLFVYLGD